MIGRSIVAVFFTRRFRREHQFASDRETLVIAACTERGERSDTIERRNSVATPAPRVHRAASMRRRTIGHVAADVSGAADFGVLSDLRTDERAELDRGIHDRLVTGVDQIVLKLGGSPDAVWREVTAS